MPGIQPILPSASVTGAHAMARLLPSAQEAAAAAVSHMQDVALGCSVPEYLVDGVFCSISLILADDAPQEAFTRLSDPDNPASAFHGSGRPGLDDIVLRGARFLTDQAYPYAIDIMISEAEHGRNRGSRENDAILPHIFLRVHAAQAGQSYIADPMIKFDCVLKDRQPVCFETVFTESREYRHHYDLRDGSPIVKTSLCLSLDR
jgi:hypothetical protein